MRVCVLGLGHLGTVTAACLSHLGHQVVGVDFDAELVSALNDGLAPVSEPGLVELLAKGRTGNLRFVASLDAAARSAQVLWVAYDTPADADGNADPDAVLVQTERAMSMVSADCLVLVSSQLSVGSIRRMEHTAALRSGAGAARIACNPENLRLGSAVRDFLHPDRLIVGTRSDQDKQALAVLLGSITQSIEWMSVESAEMTKHAINAFLATSVAFANEIASLCEAVGADARDVARGLKTEGRIGPRAYLSPGSAFSGVTLARDVGYLNERARERQIVTPVLSSVLASNDAHKSWVERRLRALFPNLGEATVAIWGLAYKTGTDSMQGSATVALCDRLLRAGVKLRVHDSGLRRLPQRWAGAVALCASPLDAVCGADALVIGTLQPEYCGVTPADLRHRPGLVVLDANRTVPALASGTHELRYFAVGLPELRP